MSKKINRALFMQACRIWFCPAEERTQRELQSLTPRERERVWADLSGEMKVSGSSGPVSALPTEESVDESLSKLDAELGSIPVKDGYNQARCQNSVFTDSRAFRLMFLRATNFDPKESAERIVYHFEAKKELFGIEKLTKEITLEDLDDDDLDCLGSGCLQWLPNADSAGRKVLFLRATFVKPKYRENFYRTLWYTFMVAAQDESVQRLGLVMIVYLMDAYESGDMELRRASTKILTYGLPTRFVARYFMFHEGVWKHIVEMMTNFSSTFFRLRTRTVTGTYQECLYALLCLGISPDSLPIRSDGSTMCLANHAKWIALRQQIESSVLYPTN